MNLFFGRGIAVEDLKKPMIDQKIDTMPLCDYIAVPLVTYGTVSYTHLWMRSAAMP